MTVWAGRNDSVGGSEWWGHGLFSEEKAVVREQQVRTGELFEGMDFRFLPAVGMTVWAGRNGGGGSEWWGHGLFSEEKAVVREQQVRTGELFEGMDFRFLPAVGMTVWAGRNGGGTVYFQRNDRLGAARRSGGAVFCYQKVRGLRFRMRSVTAWTRASARSGE